MDSGDDPVLFTGTGNVEHKRYLHLINSPESTSASGLKAGGVLVADDYRFAYPSRNDLVVISGAVGTGVLGGVLFGILFGILGVQAVAQTLLNEGRPDEVQAKLGAQGARNSGRATA